MPVYDMFRKVNRYVKSSLKCHVGWTQVALTSAQPRA